MLFGVGALYGAYVGPLYSVLHVSPGGVEETLSVPLQQMARVHKYEYESLESQDLELLYRAVPKENLDSYRATVSDYVKKGFIREGFEENKQELFILWCKWGIEHPLIYLNSFLSEPGEEIILLPGVHEYYEAISLDPEVQRRPFRFLVLSPGWYLLMTAMIFVYLWRCRRSAFLLAGVMFLLSFLTVLAGPMALVRYVLIFYFAFPILLSAGLCSESFAPVAGSREG